MTLTVSYWKESSKVSLAVQTIFKFPSLNMATPNNDGTFPDKEMFVRYDRATSSLTAEQVVIHKHLNFIFNLK